MLLKTKFKRIICFIFAIITLFSVINVNTARADNTDYPFDYTNVLDDLESSSNFKLTEYPWASEAEKSAGIINVVEWCYSPFKPGEFALYVYFYNPQGLSIDADAPSNRIQMATAYSNEDGTPAKLVNADTVPSSYDTFKLVYCNQSEKTNYEGLFYKFRVVDQIGDDGLKIEERVYSGTRRYDISGITLVLEDGTYKEFTVGGTYFFEGYAKGYGANENAESTLKNTKFTPLETIRLEVTSTNYVLPETSGLGDNHYNNINSVYFSVPNKYLRDESGKTTGNLQKIKAEWFEYKTQPIMIFETKDRYNQVEPYIGVDIGDRIDEIPQQYWESRNNIDGSIVYKGFTYNCGSYYNFDNIAKPITTLYYAFVADDGVVTASELEAYVKNYTKTAKNGYLPVKNGKISADLFTNDVDEGRTRGYNNLEIDANDRHNLLLDNRDFWDKLFGLTSTTTLDINPIHKISDTDLSKTNENFSTSHYVFSDDAENIKNKAQTAISNDETPYLFRFAVTDYYNNKMYSERHSQFDTTARVAWVAQETVFFDFKIIQLTFQYGDATYKVIPVTQNPIDIYSNIIPITSDVPWWWFAVIAGATGLLTFVIVYYGGVKLAIPFFDDGNYVRAILVTTICLTALYFVLYTGIGALVLMGG